MSIKQVSGFDRGIIVVYSTCKLSFREIGARGRRTQTMVMYVYN